MTIHFFDYGAPQGFSLRRIVEELSYIDGLGYQRYTLETNGPPTSWDPPLYQKVLLTISKLILYYNFPKLCALPLIGKCIVRLYDKNSAPSQSSSLPKDRTIDPVTPPYPVILPPTAWLDEKTFKDTWQWLLDNQKVSSTDFLFNPSLPLCNTDLIDEYFTNNHFLNYNFSGPDLDIHNKTFKSFDRYFFSI